MIKSSLLFSLFLLLSISSFAQEENYYGGDNGKKLDWVMYYLSENYVDSTDNDFLADIAIQRIVEELDPYSSYQTKQELEEQNNKDNGLAPKGIGFNFYMLNGTQPIITHITPGGPADKAGLKKGYQLQSINNVSLTGKNYNQISTLLNDAKDDRLSILIFDYNNSMNTHLLEKDNLPYYSVESHYMINGDIGYIKVSSFTMNTIDEVVPKITALKAQGMESLILDLRGNNGGVKDQATKLADVFLDGNKLIHYAEGFNMPKEEYMSTPSGEFLSGKLLILANDYSASASEIFIAALQDWDRALVLGKQTYGKGLIQQSYALNDGSAIRLTIGKYFTPAGRHLQRPINDRWLDDYQSVVSQTGYSKDFDFPAQYFSKTKSGRKIVAGNGGIFPDVYFVKPEQDMRAYNRYNEGGYLYGFASYHVSSNRTALLSRFKNSTAFRTDPNIDREIAEAFRKYISFNGFSEAKDGAYGTPRTVVDKVKAWIAGQLWDDNAYYELSNHYDPEVKKAIELIQGNSFKQIGIKK